MKRGLRIVHDDEGLVEKPGRNDPCPCGSGKSFQEMLPALRPVSTARGGMIIGANEGGESVQPGTLWELGIVSPEFPPEFPAGQLTWTTPQN